jgi:hypothetical protein
MRSDQVRWLSARSRMPPKCRCRLKRTLVAAPATTRAGLPVVAVMVAEEQFLGQRVGGRDEHYQGR